MTAEHAPLPDAAMDQLFREARTYYAWEDRPVPETMLRALYDLLKWGPTSANSQPGRYLFLTSKDAKERLRPFLIESNVDKTMSAPVVCLVGYDLRFHDQLPTQFPHTDAKSWFEGNDALIEETAMRNGSMQGAYLIMAARSLGLDCGPMSGFDRKGATEAFFKGTTVHANFLCNIGYGTEKNLFPRGPRLSFEEAAEIL